MTERNPFGGKNPHGLYIPLSEDEQEVLERIIAGDDLEIVVHGWGVVRIFKAVFGDSRFSCQWRQYFDRPEAPTPLHYLDLELRLRSGITLFRKKLPTVYGGKPVQICAGSYLDIAWDIAIDAIDPKVVKALKPGTRGLTSRRLDKDTGQLTARGNMQLDPNKKRLLQYLLAGQRAVRQADQEKMDKILKGEA